MLQRPLEHREISAPVSATDCKASRTACTLLDFSLLSNLQGIIDLNAQVSDCTFQSTVAEQ
jgi:hypothetical protein